MHSLTAQAVLAGVFFTVYPLLLRYSGVDGNLRTAVWCFVALVSVVPFALWSGLAALASANWWVLSGAGLLGAAALLLLNAFLAGATQQQAGALFVLMNVTQIAAGALYYVVMNGGLSVDKAAGFACAVVAVWLLFR